MIAPQIRFVSRALGEKVVGEGGIQGMESRESCFFLRWVPPSERNAGGKSQIICIHEIICETYNKYISYLNVYNNSSPQVAVLGSDMLFFISL